MKYLLVLLAFVSAVFVLSLTGAQDATQLDEPRLVSISVLPAYAPEGKMTSMHVTAQYSVPFLQPDGRTTENAVLTITLDLLKEGKEGVDVYYEATRQTVTVNFEEIAADLVAACRKKYYIIYPGRHPDPLPVRKALRTTK